MSKEQLVICSRVATGECYHDCAHRRPHEPTEFCTTITKCRSIKKECLCIPYEVVNKD